MKLISIIFFILATRNAGFAGGYLDNQKLFNCLEKIVKAQSLWREPSDSRDNHHGAIFGLISTAAGKNRVEGVLVSQITLVAGEKISEGLVVVTKKSFNCHELPEAKVSAEADSAEEFRKRSWPPFELAYPKDLLPSAPIRLSLESNENNLRTPDDERDDWDEGDRLTRYEGREKLPKFKPHSCLNVDAPERRGVLVAIAKEISGYQSAMGWGFRSSLPDYDFENSSGLISNPTPKEIRFGKIEANLLATCKLIGDRELNLVIRSVASNMRTRLGQNSKKRK